jgi:hypothetical protein
MFALSRGELAMVLFIFLLIWSSGFLPRLGEKLGERFADDRAPGSREGG